MHHNNPLTTKRNLRLSKFKHCMQGCQDIWAFVTMRRIHLDVDAFLCHINIVNLGQWDFWVARAKLMANRNYVVFVVVKLTTMEKISSHSLGRSKHFHECILGNWKFSVVKCVMTKNFQLPNLQWPKKFIHQTISDKMLSLWLCWPKVFGHHMQVVTENSLIHVMVTWGTAQEWKLWENGCL